MTLLVNEDIAIMPVLNLEKVAYYRVRCKRLHEAILRSSKGRSIWLAKFLDKVIIQRERYEAVVALCCSSIGILLDGMDRDGIRNCFDQASAF